MEIDVKGLILVNEPDIVNKYTNIVVAMHRAYKDLQRVEFGFVNGDVDDDFIKKIKEDFHSREYPEFYEESSDLGVGKFSINLDAFKAGSEWDIIDITTLIKEAAVHFVVSTIDNDRIKVCSLSTKDKPKNGYIILEENRYSYDDLLQHSTTSKVYKKYWRRNKVLKTFFSTITFPIALIGLNYFYGLQIPEEAINLLSLSIGAAGLYLAYCSYAK